tara:strand:+ start:400 stop:651 length:252 start_codon:yes stop_codon:yes gene_type:complete
MENKKLSTEEVATLKNYQDITNEIVGGLGQIRLQTELLEQKEEQLLERFKDLQKDQITTAEELTKKYGDGNLDIEKGEFIPSK